jgi:hypothetical protein
MRGVVFISIITSGSALPLALALPTFIPIGVSFSLSRV